MLSSKLTSPQVLLTLTVSALTVEAGSRAWAHQVHDLKKNNRYVLLVAQGHRAVMAYSIWYGRLPSAGLRSRVDGDLDGRLSAAEVERFLSEEKRRIGSGLRVDLDGVRREVRFSDGAVNLLGRTRVGPYPVAVELVAVWNVSRGRHRFRFEDRTGLNLPGETHLVVKTGPEVRLLESHAGTWSAGLKTRFTFLGSPAGMEDRSVTVVYQAAVADRAMEAGSAPGGSAGSVRGVLLVVLCGLAVAAVAAAVLWYRAQGRDGRRPDGASRMPPGAGPSAGT